MFLEAMADRKKETLMDLIYRHIESGKTIISDCWSAYDTIWLNQLGYTHVIVNHSCFFKDLVISAYTNSIEGTWMHVKRLLNKNGTRRALLTNYFVEFMWHRRFMRGNIDPFVVFLNHIILYHHIVLAPDRK